MPAVLADHRKAARQRRRSGGAAAHRIANLAIASAAALKQEAPVPAVRQAQVVSDRIVLAQPSLPLLHDPANLAVRRQDLARLAKGARRQLGRPGLRCGDAAQPRQALPGQGLAFADPGTALCRRLCAGSTSQNHHAKGRQQGEGETVAGHCHRAL